MSCLQSINATLYKVLLHSGHFIQRIGQYDNCILENQMTYNLMLLANNQTKQLNDAFIGLCLPSICQQQQIIYYTNELLNQTNTSMVVGQLKSYTQNLSYPFTWVFYLTIIILVTALITTLIATLFSKNIKKIKFINSFNFKNSIKIFQQKNNPLNVLNGIRSLAMIWVIWAHEQTFKLVVSINTPTVEFQVLTYTFLFVEAGLFAVDTFFFLGGFFTIYTIMRTQFNSLIKYPLAIIHRILRVWPSYIIAILIFYSVFIHLGRGPFCYCQRMWKPLFFVDNFVDGGSKQCLVWGWYIQNDIQIFIFSMVILSLSVYSLKLTKIIALVSLVGSLIYTFAEVMINDYVQITQLKDFQKWGQYFSNVYIMPWARCPPYLYGFLFGISYIEYENIKQKSNQQIKQNLLYRLKDYFKNSRKYKYICQLIGVFIIMFLVLIPRTLQLGYKWPTLIHALYLSLGKLLFVMGLSFIVLPSLLGINGFVRFSLDTTLFNFIAKISFCTYLVHLMFVYLPYHGRRNDFYYTQIGLTSFFFTHLILSLLLGFIITVIIEVPFSKIEKEFIGKIKNKVKQENKQKKQVSQLEQKNQIETNLLINKQ